MAILVTLAAYKPVVRSLGLARHGDIVPRLCLQVLGVVPVYRHVTDELESVHELGVVLGQVGGHLQRAVHRHIKRQLAYERGVHTIGVVAPRAQLCLQDARRVVHGATLQTGEGQYHGVVGIAAAESLVLRAAGALVAYQVGIGAAKACGTGCLVGVDHDVMLGGLLHGIEIVVVHGLRVVMVAAGDDVSHVTGFHGVVAVIIHQLVGLLHPSLIVGDAGGSLVMHHELHALGVGIVVEILDVEVGIGRDEVEHIPFPAVGPVFPTHVPTFH